MPSHSGQSPRVPGFASPWTTGGDPVPGPPSGKPERRLPAEVSSIAYSPQYLLYLAEIGENTAGLVHDMRSPLTVIINGLRLCHRMPLPQIARQRLALALEEAERLNHMVNDVIAFARYDRPVEFPWQALEAPPYLPRPDGSTPRPLAKRPK
ncbi:histidine kinase dimerization/phospho-acceptor domain-containing protein [Nodosilinea nodulosa]|uniref:histidine kinase dimerization/phospho-acceptor domain-containing protein n=1 Tax=Nodosilinea nodulosa TaxID=416001 RepID=UPI0003064D04|nr:histidine kinase dimerization/phospho-acceptor domain-containing protein [Nodosilinea nodulosa]